MTKLAALSIILSSLILVACGGSSSNSADNLSSDTSLPTPKLPTSIPALAVDPIQGTWLLSYSGSHNNRSNDASSKGNIAGKILLPLNKVDDKYYFNDCLSDNLLELEDWAFELDNTDLSYSDSFDGTVSINDGPLVSATKTIEAKFELTNNNQFTGKVTTNSKEGTDKESITFNFNAVKISNASSPSVATEIDISLTASNGSIEHTQNEYPLECIHLRQKKSNYSGPEGNFLLIEETLSSNFNTDTDASFEGNIFSSTLVVSEKTELNAQQLESKFIENENPIIFDARTNCVKDDLNDCTTIQSHTQIMEFDSANNISFKVSSENTAGNTFTGEFNSKL